MNIVLHTHKPKRSQLKVVLQRIVRNWNWIALALIIYGVFVVVGITLYTLVVALTGCSVDAYLFRPASACSVMGMDIQQPIQQAHPWVMLGFQSFPFVVLPIFIVWWMLRQAMSYAITKLND